MCKTAKNRKCLAASYKIAEIIAIFIMFVQIIFKKSAKNDKLLQKCIPASPFRH
jgi:hypothetical protein